MVFWLFQGVKKGNPGQWQVSNKSNSTAKIKIFGFWWDCFILSLLLRYLFLVFIFGISGICYSMKFIEKISFLKGGDTSLNCCWIFKYYIRHLKIFAKKLAVWFPEITTMNSGKSYILKDYCKISKMARKKRYFNKRRRRSV